MADKSLFQKMFIKSGMKMVIVNLPADLTDSYRAAPDGVQMLSEPQSGLDVLQVFVNNEKELRESFSTYKPFLLPKGVLWICYPKGTSGVQTDINRDTIWRISHEYGLDAVGQIAVNDTWSAMRIKITST